jgi:putative addiction module component (TIGR02574 family)
MAVSIDEVLNLPVDERIELVERIWESIASEPGEPAPTDAQKEELRRRAAAHAADPDCVIPWDEVKAAALARSRR